MRRNGFFANGRVSLNLHQLAAGTAYVALLVAFYATQSPVFANAGTRAGLEIAFAVMTCFVLVLFAKAAGTDPGDVGGGTHVSGTHGVGVGVDANDDDPQTSPEMLFCDLCAKDVSHGSKHCRTCDKCVKHFDHHCVWLNNCVGSKNYHSFLVLVFGTFLQVVGQLVIGAYLTHGAVTKKDDTNETLRRNGVFVTRQTWLVCSTCVMLFGFVTAYVLGDLLGFHFILNKRGLTTLEFISASRDEGEDTTANEPTTGGDGCGSDAKGGAFCGKTWSCMRKQCRNGTAKVVPDVVSGESGENAHRGSDPRGGRKKRKRVKIACWALFNSDAKPKPKKRDADVERASAPEENPGR